MKHNLNYLNTQFHKITKQIRKIELDIFINANKCKIGTCLKFRNSYSSPDKSWWAYKRLTGLSKHLQAFISFSFETDIYGNQTTNKRDFDMLSGWVECPEEEYLEAWATFKTKIFDTQA